MKDNYSGYNGKLTVLIQELTTCYVKSGMVNMENFGLPEFRRIQGGKME
jgi:hypothetical protein